jgi:hypothetical protein
MYQRNRVIVLLLLATILANCGQPPVTTTQSSDVTPVFAFSEAVVGRNRLAIGLVRSGTPLNDPAAKVHLRFFNLDENNPQPKAETDATYYGQGLPAGFYVAYPTFDKPGNWGVEIQVQLPGQPKPSTSKQRLEVKEHSKVPNIGEPAIAVKTLTVKDVPDLAHLSSGTDPDPAMYQVSLDQALRSDTPTALLFATPGFCKTATCGPSLQVMQGLRKHYGDKMNFIHVEVYTYPFGESAQRQDNSGLSDPMVAWHLQSEPWLFLIDAKGMIAARFEGGITKEELGPALEKLIAGQPVVVGD